MAARAPASHVPLLALALLLQLLALVLQTLTLASGGYGGVLSAAMALTCLADACLLPTLRRGGPWSRGVALLLFLPTLLIVADSIRRLGRP